MKFDLTPVLKNSGASLDIVFDETLDMIKDGIGTVVFTGPVHVEGKVKNFNDMLELDVNASVPYMTQCDRCCESLTGTVEVHIREDIAETPTGPDTTLPVDDDKYFFTGHSLYLDVIVSEALLLGTPVYNLCRDNCLGLCPLCGANLNSAACACASQSKVDPRLEVLTQFTDQ